MKLAILGDSHFQVRGGDLDFLEFQLKWHERMFAEMQKQGITTCVQVGDFMDNRKVLDVRVGQYLTKRFLPLLEKYDIRFFTLLGNHNLFYRESVQIHNLWFLEHHSRFNVINSPQTMFGNILMLPWICKENQEACMQAVSNGTEQICIGHLELTDFPMYKGVMATTGLDPLAFKRFELVVSGHYHTVSKIGNIHYTGSPYHLTWADYPDDTERGWFVLDTEKKEMDMQHNTQNDSLFAIHEYDPAMKYEPALLQHLAGKIVRFIVSDRGDTKKYNKFLASIKEVKMIEYKIVDETIIDIKQTTATIDTSLLIANTLTAITDYAGSLAETVDGADVNMTKEIARDLYERANRK